MVFDSSAGLVNLRAYSLFNQAMHSIHAKAIAFAAKTCTNLLCKYVYKLKHIIFKCVCVCRYGKYAHSLIFIHFANFLLGKTRSVQTRCKVYLQSSPSCHMSKVYAHLHLQQQKNAARTSKISNFICWRVKNAKKNQKRQKATTFCPH